SEYTTRGQADAERCGPDASPSTGSYFGMFAVSPTRQGNGLGDTLLRLAERHAVTAWSAAWMDLLVIAQRAELIAWYQRRGYVLTTRTSPFPYDDERFGRPLRPDLYFAVLRKRFGDRPGFSDR
ncbi:GNAT family N-acetyltransferase, partial [Frankia sp. CcWB2]